MHLIDQLQKPAPKGLLFNHAVRPKSHYQVKVWTAVDLLQQNVYNAKTQQLTNSGHHAQMYLWMIINLLLRDKARLIG